MMLRRLASNCLLSRCIFLPKFLHPSPAAIWMPSEHRGNTSIIDPAQPPRCCSSFLSLSLCATSTCATKDD
uniref:Putative secreted protein n=1 Tax=Anopheles darlingi TaxID=43151 RepID=A0A2M4D094_ANODA